MNKINTDIISTTGININKYNILPSKIFINGVEITDTESWNKAINKIDEKDKEIDRLNKECDTYMKIAAKRGNIIEELENYVKKERDTTIFSQYYFNAMCNVLDKLKELKEDNK